MSALLLAVLGSCLLMGAERASALGQITYGGCVSASGSGGLCATGNSSALDGPTSVAASPDGRSLYTTGLYASALALFDRAPEGRISYVGCVSDTGSGGACADLPGTPVSIPSSVAVSPDGRSVYVASITTVAVFDRAPAGQLTYGGCVSNTGSGGSCADLPGEPLNANGRVAVSPDGKTVYATGVRDVVALDRAPAGQLTYGGCVSNDGSGGNCADAPGAPFDNNGSLAVSPKGDTVYVTGTLTDTVSVLDRAPGGQLTYAGCVSNDGSGGLCADAPGTPLRTITSVAVSPDGRTVYAGSYGGDDVAVLDRAPGGQITYAGCVSDDGSAGQCADVPGAPLDGPESLAVSPDGTILYIGSTTSHAITMLERASDGQLTYSSCISDDGSGGLCADAPGTPLGTVESIAISPEGGSLYAASFSMDTVSRLFRKTAPETEIDSGPAEGSTTDDSTPQFEFSADQSGASFECSIDAQPLAACSSPHTTANLADGKHEFAVRAVTGGDPDPTPAARTFTVRTQRPVDRTAPNARFTTKPKRKLRTTKRRVKVSAAFSADEANATFACSLDGGTFKPCSSPQSYRVGRGKHAIAVTALDAADNAGPAVTARFKVKRKSRR